MHQTLWKGQRVRNASAVSFVCKKERKKWAKLKVNYNTKKEKKNPRRIDWSLNSKPVTLDCVNRKGKRRLAALCLTEKTASKLWNAFGSVHTTATFEMVKKISSCTQKKKHVRLLNSLNLWIKKISRYPNIWITRISFNPLSSTVI